MGLKVDRKPIHFHMFSEIRVLHCLIDSGKLLPIEGAVRLDALSLNEVQVDGTTNSFSDIEG